MLASVIGSYLIFPADYKNVLLLLVFFIQPGWGLGTSWYLAFLKKSIWSSNFFPTQCEQHEERRGQIQIFKTFFFFLKTVRFCFIFNLRANFLAVPFHQWVTCARGSSRVNCQEVLVRWFSWLWCFLNSGAHRTAVPVPGACTNNLIFLGEKNLKL